MSTAEQRRRLRAWYRAYRRSAAAWRARYGDTIPPPLSPPLPVDLVGPLVGPWICGARTRAGTPCRRAAAVCRIGSPADITPRAFGVPHNGRCRLHGGAATGPRTAQGKARARENGRCPKRRATAPV